LFVSADRNGAFTDGNAAKCFRGKPSSQLRPPLGDRRSLP
jgi:hypothetical protein